MFGRLHAMENAFQLVICHGYSGVACLNANIFFLLKIGPFPKTLTFLPEPLPKYFYFIHIFSKSTNQLVTNCRHSPFIAMNHYETFIVQTSTILPSMPQEPTKPMNWEIRLLITDELVELCNNRLKLKTLGKLLIIVHDFVECASN